METLDCDVSRAVAEGAARQAALRAVEPSHALYTKYEARVLGASLVRYPIYYLRYRYDGEAREHGPEHCAVAVSARSGRVVAAKHPPSGRVVAGKLEAALLVQITPRPDSQEAHPWTVRYSGWEG